MNLNAPTQLWFLISAVLFVLGLLGHLGMLASVAALAANTGWLLIGAWVILAASCMMKGM